jgi:competence protein ComEC
MGAKSKKIWLLLGGLILIFGILLGLIWWQDRDRRLAVHFFDIGQGDSIFISTPSHQNILIDGGPDSSVLSKLGRAMPFYDRTIDLMILTHAHSDHVAGLVDVVKRYNVEKVLYTGAASNSADFLEWLDLISQKGIALVKPMAGQVYKFGEADLEILYPFEDISQKEFKDLNDTSIVTRLEYQNTSFLFTGDAPETVEGQLLMQESADLKSDVLKVGHHGSKYSSSLEFLKTVGPQYAVIQLAQDNKFGHPHKITLNKLNGLRVQILRNDEEGDVELVSDGKEMFTK